LITEATVLVSTWLGDCLWVGKLSTYWTNQPGPLSLAIPLWVDTESTSKQTGTSCDAVVPYP